MALCNSRAISNPLHHRRAAPGPSSLFSTACLPPKRNTMSFRKPGFLHFATPLLRAMISEEASTSLDVNSGGVPDRVITTDEPPPSEATGAYEAMSSEASEELPTGEQMQIFEVLDKLNIKLDSEDTYSFLLYGSGALVTLWLTSALVGAIDSIPVFPKLLEIVGLVYTIWFSSRYLILKKNREEMFAKIEEFKEEVFGSTDN